jgi:hypothetical protein
MQIQIRKNENKNINRNITKSKKMIRYISQIIRLNMEVEVQLDWITMA